MTGSIVEGLLTWLWQGSVLAALASVVLLGVRAGSASTRYLVWWMILAAIVALPLAGSWVSRPDASVPGAIVTAVIETAVAPSTSTGLVRLPSTPAYVVTLVVAGWLALASFRLRRLVWAIARLAARRGRCRPLPSARLHALRRWRALRHRGRRTRVCVSDDLAVPALLGLGSPTVAIPRHLLSALTNDELDHVVLHEHAHAQRWDDWTLLLQSVVLALIGMHPGVRLAARALDRERELACDDEVMRRGGCPRVYALGVTKVAELALGNKAPALAPGMSTERGALTRRVERLLDRSRPPATRRRAPIVLATAVGALAGVVALFGVLPPLVSTAPRGAGVTAVHNPASDAAPSALPITLTPRPATAPPPPALGVRGAVAERGVNTIRARETSVIVDVDADAGTTVAVHHAVAPDPLRPTEAQTASRALERRTLEVTTAPLIGGPAPTTWRPLAPPLASRPMGPSWTPSVLAPHGPPAAPSPWRQMADGGKAIGNKTAQAGKTVGRQTAQAAKTTASAFTRVGSAIGRAFSGGP